MYSCLPSFILGFHGCDKDLGEKVLSGTIGLIPSNNDYDWLGHGIYFWENSPKRALNYAQLLKNNPERTKVKITEPFALGAIIDLGYCLNLIESRCLQIVKQGYTLLVEASEQSGMPLPKNKPITKEGDLLLRKLDCAVIEVIHEFNKKHKQKEYDSVRGVFWEGEDLYPNAGFKVDNHIQVCIKNPNCIKGYFRPLDPIKEYPLLSHHSA